MKAVVLALLLGTSIVGQAQSAPKFPKSQAHRFSQLWGQGTDGRYEPVETLNNELLRKLYRKNKYKQQTSTQVILGMLLYPTQWQKEPIIKIKSELALKYGFKDNFISYSDMFSSDGKYKIEREAQAAYSKAPAERGRFEKDIIDLDEKINISYSIYTGSFLRIIPSSKDNHKWLVPGEIKDDAQSGKHKIMLQAFLHSIQKGNLTDADNVLSEFEELQNSWEHIPSATKKKMELIYNKYNIFKSLFPFFLTLSIVLLFIVFINIIRGVPTSNKVLITINSLLFIGFLAHTVGLIMRWYIAGHAPWSNGYESMIYIAWSSMLAGLLFARKNPIVVGVASLMTGLTLLVAHLNWLNPEITLLVPVLKSYWLMLHVAIITASYGFLGISFFLSVFNFTLWNFKNENRKQISRLITQLTMISEMFITIGIYFLTIGIFIGGIWANESWGRYWGWDPKETWSLITLLIYAFVLHMRFIPGLRGKFAFNLGALLSFGMVIMTYFGVNYFLSGLHSYASADAFTVPKWVYISLVLVVSLVISAYIKQREEDSILKQ